MAKIAACFDVSNADGITALKRHSFGDSGERTEEDRREKDQGLEDGSKILFPFTTESGARFWLISDADRSMTTILLAG